eukprot:Nk52_evm91s914 gene=Nk52_evmTU91s914
MPLHTLLKTSFSEAVYRARNLFRVMSVTGRYLPGDAIDHPPGKYRCSLFSSSCHAWNRSGVVEDEGDQVPKRLSNAGVERLLGIGVENLSIKEIEDLLKKPISKLRVVDLKQILSQLKLPASGKKAILIERIEGFYSGQAENVECFSAGLKEVGQSEPLITVDSSPILEERSDTNEISENTKFRPGEFSENVEPANNEAIMLPSSSASLCLSALANNISSQRQLKTSEAPIIHPQTNTSPISTDVLPEEGYALSDIPVLTSELSVEESSISIIPVTTLVEEEAQLSLEGDSHVPLYAFANVQEYVDPLSSYAIPMGNIYSPRLSMNTKDFLPPVYGPLKGLSITLRDKCIYSFYKADYHTRLRGLYVQDKTYFDAEDLKRYSQLIDHEFQNGGFFFRNRLPIIMTCLSLWFLM